MGKSIITTFLIFTSIATSAELTVQERSCAQQRSDEKILYSSDFKWGVTLEELKNKYQEIYDSGKRLKGRAFSKGGQALMPIDIFGGEVKYTKLPKIFIQSVTKHVEEAFKGKYIHSLIFPDMGHSHLFIPMKDYQELKKIPVKEKHIFYQKVFQLPGLKVLYHTAEQLTIVGDDRRPMADRILQWRFYTRNLVGGNQALGKLEFLHNVDSDYNTAREYSSDYYYYGAGFNISASKDGCFPFVVDGKTHYFDLSFKDLAPRTLNSW